MSDFKAFQPQQWHVWEQPIFQLDANEKHLSMVRCPVLTKRNMFRPKQTLVKKQAPYVKA